VRSSFLSSPVVEVVVVVDCFFLVVFLFLSVWLLTIFLFFLLPLFLSLSLLSHTAISRYVVRLAQGLLHMGKGLVTLSPMHSDRMLSSPTALAGLLTVAFLGLDIQNTLCHHELGYMLYTIVCAMRPRSLCTLDEEGNQIKTGVRVGEAVETVGQAGKPKTISGFQTHTSPVLMGVGDRAELATEEYIAATNVLEGFAILKKNPDYDKQEAERKAEGKRKRSKRRGGKK